MKSKYFVVVILGVVGLLVGVVKPVVVGIKPVVVAQQSEAVEEARRLFQQAKQLSKKKGLKPRLLRRNVFGAGHKSPLQKQLLTSDF